MKRYILSFITIFISLSIMGQELQQNDSIKSSFETPDFNYPQTVTTDADKRLATAIKEQNNEDIMLALIQSSLAQSMISSENLSSIIENLIEAKNAVNDDCVKASIDLLEAHILNAYRNQYRYKLANRKNLTAANYSNIDEWDNEQFQSRISELLDSALAYQNALTTAPVTKYSKFVKINDESVDTYPTMYDFIAYRSITIYNSWGLNSGWNPFLKTSSASTGYTGKVNDIYDSLLQLHKKGTRAYTNALLKKMSYNETDTRERLASLYSEYRDNPDAAPAILLAYTDKIDDAKEKHSLLKDFLQRFPDNVFAPRIQIRMLSLELPKASLSFNAQYTTADSVTMVCKVENVNRFKVSVFKIDKAYTLKINDLSKYESVASKEFTLPDTVPFIDTIKVTMPPLTYGYYTATITAFDKNGKEIQQTNKNYSKFIVSNLTTFGVAQNVDKSRRIFTINAITGAPEKNVMVSSSIKGKNPEYFNRRTNSDGYVTANDTRFGKFEFTKGKDTCLSAIITNYFYTKNYDDFHNRASIFTDLAIYRPGETINLSAVCYRINTETKELQKNKQFKVSFCDANNDTIATETVTTDELGRLSHKFIVPTDRMNGAFSININDAANNASYGNCMVTVSEYKTPTFFIEFIDTKNTYSATDSITLRAVAKTYSDIPVGNIPVKCVLRSAILFFGFTEIASFDTKTDENGEFTIMLDAKAIKDKEESPFCTYRITAYGTDAAGETQSGSTTFNLGNSIVLTWDYDDNKLLNVDATKETKLPVTIKSNDANAPASYACTLALNDLSGNLVATKSFQSDKPVIDFSDIASGEYRLSIWVDEDSTTRIKDKRFVVFRPTDKQSPIASALWTPYDDLKCAPGETVEIILGNSFANSYVYYTVNYKDRILKSEWIKLPKGISRLKYAMPQDIVSSSLIIQLYCVKDLIPYQYNITVLPELPKRETTLTIESFRDKITAGDSEKWTLHLANNGQPLAGSAIIAAMTDKAINTLRDNRWYFNPSCLFAYTFRTLSIQNRNQWGGNTNNFNWTTELNDIIAGLRKAPSILAPQLNLYNQQYFRASVKFGSRMLATVASVRGSSNEEEVFFSMDRLTTIAQDALAKNTESAFGSADEIVSESNDAETTEKQLDDVQLRTSQIKTAFWKPELVTDENGNAKIKFIVPDYNTTWMFQAIGYNNELDAATLLKETVSNKPIMVKSNMPRFLRQGDTATLMASVQNATDSAQNCTAVIEIINPFNNEVYASHKTSVNLYAKSSEAVSIEYSVPDNVSAIGFRIKAVSGRFGDGEQVMIPVLQSISAVVESKPFFIDNGTSEYTITLPEFKDDALVTFDYCDNPMWYVASALPSINSNDNTTATSIAHSIFANLVARKIAKDNPIIGQALQYWREHPQDSALVSMLAKNQDLKIGTLLASPWLKESEAQTLRMSQLSDLFNSAASSTANGKLIDKLAELQLKDGGFAWFRYPNVVSSEYTTIAVMQLLGDAKALGAIESDDNLSDIINKGIGYLDRAVIDRYNKQKNKLSFSGYGDYAYTRSLFLDIPMSVTVKDLYGNIIKSLTQEWKKMNIVNKAYTALTLANFGMTASADPILESISQFSIYKPATGRYWDNFQSGWYTYCNKVTLTSIVLQAYGKIRPQSQEIDQIRKWMLLEKQTTDWGNSSLAADAVCAMLSTGSNWLQTNSTPTFSLNGKPFTLGTLDKILGYGKINLNIDDKTGKNSITIKRDGDTPAWGAVYSRYNAPMKDVKAASISGLSITKDIIAYDTDKELQVGDKVQVRILIKSSRNLEYVTVSDERAACLEPVNQTSEYRFEDGTGYYMEVKDSKTNMFFNHLPKGTHVITYDAYITNTGDFNNGIATIQCQYAPQNTAHSAGAVISVK